MYLNYLYCYFLLSLLIFSDLVGVELTRESDGSPSKKKLRKLDPCFDARQLVLQVCQTSQEIKTFYDFYNATENFQGHSE